MRDVTIEIEKSIQTLIDASARSNNPMIGLATKQSLESQLQMIGGGGDTAQQVKNIAFHLQKPKCC